jgi:hypothetical protein
MNYLTEEIHRICEEYGIKNYTINVDGSIDVDGDVDLWSRGLSELPVKFNNVSGYFNCSWNDLTTLEGCPKSVGGNFNCSWNNLTTLDFAPKLLGGRFMCFSNPIHNQLGDIDYKSYIKQLNRDKILNELLSR